MLIDTNLMGGKVRMGRKKHEYVAEYMLATGILDGVVHSSIAFEAVNDAQARRIYSSGRLQKRVKKEGSMYRPKDRVELGLLLKVIDSGSN